MFTTRIKHPTSDGKQKGLGMYQIKDWSEHGGGQILCLENFLSFNPFFYNLVGRVNLDPVTSTISVSLVATGHLFGAVLQYGDDPKETHINFESAFLRALSQRDAGDTPPGYIRMHTLCDNDGEKISIMQNISLPAGATAWCSINLKDHPGHVDDGELRLWIGARINPLNGYLDLAIQPDYPTKNERWFGAADDNENVILIGTLTVNLKTGDPTELFAFNHIDPRSMYASTEGAQLSLSDLLSKLMGSDVRVAAVGIGG